MATVEKKKLCDLGIFDIQSELANRNLDQTGTKTVIIERLKKALQSEGKDPNNFSFDVNRTGDDEEEALLEDNNTSVNGKMAVGHNPTSTDLGRIRSVPQVGEIDSSVAHRGHGQVGEDNEDDEVDLVGNSGNANEDPAVGSQSLPKPSPAKPSAGVSKSTTPAKGKKKESSIVCEGGVESFVLQEDDTVLNDIDADLLDGEGTAGSRGQAGGIKGGTNENRQGSSATADASAKLVENTDTKDGGKTTGSKDEKDSKTVTKSPAKKDDKSQNSRNLWVSGLSSSTRATDLKTLFSKHGKVIAAKVVTNARVPGSRCYGLVTLGSGDDATKCIQHLHRTELHGRMISVERAKTETQGTKEKILPPSGLRSPTKPSARPPRKSETKSSAPPKDNANQSEPSKEKTELSDKDKKAAEVVSFSKIKADQEHERLKRKEMHLEREKYKQRMIEKRQREEAFKIERERRRLREMREELERQHIETERLRLETERLQMEREKEKYRRQQQRVLQERRPLKRRGPRDDEWPPKRPVSERFHGGERFEERPAHGEREQREFNRRGEEHRTFREERPQREGRSVRDERHLRESARGPLRHESRSEWKSEREMNRGAVGGSDAWNVPLERSKMDDEWETGNMGQGDGWDNGVMLSQPSSGYIQQGQMMGTGTVYLAQPAMHGASVMMQSSMARQSDARFGMAAASVRRF